MQIYGVAVGCDNVIAVSAVLDAFQDSLPIEFGLIGLGFLVLAFALALLIRFSLARISLFCLNLCRFVLVLHAPLLKTWKSELATEGLTGLEPVFPILT